MNDASMEQFQPVAKTSAQENGPVSSGIRENFAGKHYGVVDSRLVGRQRGRDREGINV